MKKIFIFIILSILSLGSLRAEITWDLSDDGTLTIWGTDMPDYDFNTYPWYSQEAKIKEIIIENGVTKIGSYAFNNCYNLASVTIPSSVTSIGMAAFYGCSYLTSVTIPNSVTSIGMSAFSCCYNLTSITIPNSVTSIGDFAFPDCSSLTSITIPNSVTSIGTATFRDCSSLTSVTIPNSVTSIGSSAFSNCSSLTSIIIPNSVTSIGAYAFSDCPGLISVTIGNSVTSIGENAFRNCSGLTSVTIGNSVTSIKQEVFSGCSGLTSVAIGNSVTSIGLFAFRNCSSLTSITIPNSVTSIGYRAFDGCSGLTSITIPNSVTSIGKYAFNGCSSIASLTCEATTPPICIGLSFSDVNKSIPVYVPANSVAQYRGTDEWNEFNDFREIVSEDQTKANAVIAKINAIGMVEYTDASKNKIDAASKAYNTLTANQKTLVTNLDVLTKAQQTYDNLKAAAEKLAADKAVFDKYKSEIMAIIEALAREDDSDAVKEIIRKAISDIDALEYEDVISLDDNKAKVQSFVTSVNEAVEIQRAEDQKPNGIEELEFAERYNIYDLNGRKITNSVHKSGLYIINGKKYAK